MPFLSLAPCLPPLAIALSPPSSFRRHHTHREERELLALDPLGASCNSRPRDPPTMTSYAPCSSLSCVPRCLLLRRCASSPLRRRRRRPSRRTFVAGRPPASPVYAPCILDLPGAPVDADVPWFPSVLSVLSLEHSTTASDLLQPLSDSSLLLLFCFCCCISGRPRRSQMTEPVGSCDACCCRCFPSSNEHTSTEGHQDRPGFAKYNAVGAPPSLMLEHARLRGFTKYHDAPRRVRVRQVDVALVQLRCRDRDRRNRPCNAMPSTSTGDSNIYEPCTTTAAVILTRNVYHYRREYLYRRHVPLLPLPSREQLLPLRTRTARECFLGRYNHRDDARERMNACWMRCTLCLH
uniref:Uncharacterized protein n=1 Tax=Triticum urartu TaxID=4572 RepID=A0A8R7P1H5_TRIUA